MCLSNGENSKISVSNLPYGSHMCVIYSDLDEFYNTIVDFFSAGLANNEKCIYIVDTDATPIIIEFDKRGFDLSKHLMSKQFVFNLKKETYLKNGHLEPADMIRLWESAEQNALAEGYSGIRVTGTGIGLCASNHKLIDYEARLSDVFPSSKMIALCQYPEELFEQEVLAEVVHTHPIVMLGNKLVENKYYYNPNLFLEGSYVSLPKGSYQIMREDLLEE